VFHNDVVILNFREHKYSFPVPDHKILNCILETIFQETVYTHWHHAKTMQYSLWKSANFNYILNKCKPAKEKGNKIRKTAKTDPNSNFTNKLSRNRRSDPNKYSHSDELVSFMQLKKLKNTFLTILITFFLIRKHSTLPELYFTVLSTPTLYPIYLSKILTVQWNSMLINFHIAVLMFHSLLAQTQ
jgi:hypothetical protein